MPPLLLKAGKLDAFFAVGGVPLDPVGDLIVQGQARLVPIDGPGRDRLLKTVPSLSPATIAAGAYGGNAVTADRFAPAPCGWCATASPRRWSMASPAPCSIPAITIALAASHPSAREIGLATAALSPPAPLHPGAARFYSEVAPRALGEFPSAISFCDASSQSCIAGKAQIFSI